MGRAVTTSAPVTIINTPNGNWSDWTHCFVDCEIVSVAEFSTLASTLRRSLHEEGRCVERVVIDGSMPAVSCLEFLATMPRCFLGDVLFIAQEGRTFLSATGRGGERILYMLEPRDVLFYLRVYSALNRAADQSPKAPRYFAEKASLETVIIPDGGADIDSSLYLNGGLIPMSEFRAAADGGNAHPM